MENLPPDDTEFPPFDEDDLISYRRAVALAAVESTPVLPAGTTFYYSNWAFVTAGHIIEKKTDILWEEALTAYLFEPLGIHLGDDWREYMGDSITVVIPGVMSVSNPAILLQTVAIIRLSWALRVDYPVQSRPWPPTWPGTCRVTTVRTTHY
jgi:CubicO group peptidase (beta-lactamase class C family)